MGCGASTGSPQKGARTSTELPGSPFVKNLSQGGFDMSVARNEELEDDQPKAAPSERESQQQSSQSPTPRVSRAGSSKSLGSTGSSKNLVDAGSSQNLKSPGALMKNLSGKDFKMAQS